MPDVKEEINQSDQSKGNSKKVDNPAPQHRVDDIKKKPALGIGQHLFVVEWQMAQKWTPPDTKDTLK